MVIGLFIKFIKTYSKYSFVKLHHDNPNNFSILTGKNGVGKSTILEALDVFFNNREWIITKSDNARSHDARISPVFLIPKLELDSKISAISIQYFEKISEIFWNLDSSKQNSLRAEPYTGFFEYRNKLSGMYSKDDHYIFWLGKSFGKKEIEFTGIESYVKDQLQKALPDYKEKTMRESIKEVFNVFSMIYIPVEIPIYEFLRLEKKTLQDMINKDIFSEIEVILKNQKVQAGEQNISIIDLINKNLNSFVDNLASQLNDYAPGYKFDTDENGKKNLTTNDIKEKILEKFFSIRKLRKNKKPIEDLSSGEKRKALIDIAQAFLKDNGIDKKNKIMIFALDEPESSLDSSSSFDYFNRLVEISYSTQTIVTSHWYGALPTLQKGSLLFFQKNEEKEPPAISTFKLENYTGERKKLPDSFSFKSYFDLASSIISSMREQETNWLIVEGTSDQNYLTFYLQDKVQNLKIIPLGGGQSVISLYNYLYFPLSQDYEAEQLKGKILCLIDTDEKVAHFTADKCAVNNMSIVRLQHKGDEVVFEKKIDGGEHHQTEIEDIMSSTLMYDALKNLSNSLDPKNTEIEEALDFLNIDETQTYSFFSDSHFFLKPADEDATHLETKKHIKNIKEFIKNNYNKELLSREYKKLKSSETLPWVQKLENFYLTGKI